MKSNAIMTRKMGEFDVLQRTSDGYFDANALLLQWNSNSNNTRRRMDKFLDLSNTKEFITALKLKENINEIYDIKKGINTKYGKTKDEVFMHPQLFLYFCKWINILMGATASEFLISNNIIEKEFAIEYVRREIQFFELLDKIVNSDKKEVDFLLQYPIGYYRLDCLIIEDQNRFLDNIDEIQYGITIIEYDEYHHNYKLKNDSIREKHVASMLLEKYNTDNSFVDNIKIIRINDNYMYECLKHLIPYFSNFDCHCFDYLYKSNYADIRTLYEYEYV